MSLQSHGHGVLASNEFHALFRSKMALESPDCDSKMGRTVGEGLVLPDAELIVSQSRPREELVPYLKDSSTWLQRVVRHEWLIDDLADRFYGLRDSVNGADALMGGWIKGERAFQAVVTSERVHLMTNLGVVTSDNGVADPVDNALALAFELLMLPEKLNREDWQIRDIGGLTLGYREAPFAKNWDETLLFLTDGTSVKYSALKFKDRTSPPEMGSFDQDLPPWFPRPEVEPLGKPDQLEEPEDGNMVEDWVDSPDEE